MRLHPFASFRYLLPSLSDSASSVTMSFSAVFFRLPTFADFARAMSLKMSLAADVFEFAPRCFDSFC
jgi:hypothetical protein